MTSPAHPTLAEATSFLSAGNLPAAESILQSLLIAQPDSPEVIHLLGYLRHRQARYLEAITLMLHSMELSPDNPDFLNNLGETYRMSGDFLAAEHSYQRAIALRPDHADATANLGLLRLAQRDLPAAESLFRNALRLRPAYAEAHHHLGNVLREQCRYPESLDSLQTAVRLRPHYPKAWYRLGLTLLAMQRFDPAIEAFRHAVSLQPTLAEAWFDLGTLYKNQGRLDLADPCWQRTITLLPDDASAYVNLASIRTRQGLLSQSHHLLQRALQLNPDLPAIYNNLGNAFGDQGRLDEAVAVYREGLERHPADSLTHSNLLFTLNHHPDYPPARLFAEHLAWARQHAASLTPLPALPSLPPSPLPPSSPLRIGYVSADFKDNQIAIFLEPLLANHDHQNFWIKCYSDVDRPDAVTRRLRRCADAWEETSFLSDSDFAGRVRADRIDILVDLTVHAGRHRLLAFTQPAPIQMTYLGYPNTTGLAAVDYRLTDPHLDPPGLTEPFHAEKLLRLPETYFCYRPSASAPKVSPLPYLKNGHITFGSFNRLLKLTDPTISLWSHVLRALPRSRLILKAQGLSDPSTRDHLLARFASHQIPGARLELHGWSDVPSYLALMNRVDLSLDPIPFAGGTTTCHLLWQGVPTLTLAGDSPVSRIGLSLLTNVNLPDFITHSPEEYLQRAVALAKDTPRLAQLRATLRDRLRASPLMNAPRFARHIESAYRAAWQRHSQSLPPDHLTLSPLP